MTMEIDDDSKSSLNNDTNKIKLNYKISPDQSLKEIQNAMKDTVNYKITTTNIGYDANQHQPIRLTYGEYINCIRYHNNKH